MTKRNRRNQSGTFKAKVALAHSTTYYGAQEVSEADLVLTHRIATPRLEHRFADSANVARHCGGRSFNRRRHVTWMAVIAGATMCSSRGYGN
jgi:hypothetical protein